MPVLSTPLARTLISAKALAPTSFGLTDIASGRLFQRTIGGTTGPVTASGTYNGGAPSAIQFQVLKVSDNSIVKDWTTCGQASIGGGTWSATLTGVPQGGSYYIKARPANATALAQAGSNPFYIGILIVMYGQSNMLFMSSTSLSPPSASAGTTYFSGSAWGAVPGGNGVRELLNGVIAATGVPCAALNGAVSGVPISWLSKGDPSGDYTAMAAQITGAGGAFELICWHQGEGDSAGGTSESAYLAALDLLHSNLCTDFGLTKTQVPMFVAGLASVTGGASGFGNDTSWDAMERTLIDAAGNANTFYSHSNRDANVVSSNVHWDGASYGRAGKRYARSISTFYGITSGYPNWHIASAVTVDATHTTVTLNPGLGTDFTPASGNISGFQASGDNGAHWDAISPTTAVRTNATTITLTHDSIATTSSRLIRYQYGILPDISALALDNSSLALPLDNSAGTIAPTPLAVLPVPTFLSRGAGAGSGTAWTRSGVSIGTATADRFIMCLIKGKGDNVLLSSAKFVVSGQPDVNATVSSFRNNGGGASTYNAHLVYGVVPAGTSCDIQLTYAASIFNGPDVCVWSCPSSNMSSTTPTDVKYAHDSAADITSLSITNLTTAAGGFILAAAYSSNLTSNSGAVSGTETYAGRENLATLGGQNIAADASGITAQAGANTVTATYTQTGRIELIAASFR